MNKAEKFIIRAKSIHGDKYSYDKVSYINAKTKTTIVCPIHGDFLQAPDHHLRGQGCPKCGGSIKPTKEQFISKARVVHGNRYDYSKVVYKNNKTKVTIICPTHGEFEQSPVNHLQGKGCSKCSGKYKQSTEEFIEKSKSIWGEDKFDYSKCVYKSSRAKVTLICKKHDVEFNQGSHLHLSKHICCPQCLLEIRGCKPDGYWTYETCYNTAKRYEWLKDFKSLDTSCYVKSSINGYLKDFTWLKRHYSEEEDILTAKKHLIYAYLYSETNSIYIGLTINLEQRDKQHRDSFHYSSVQDYSNTLNVEIPNPIVLEDRLLLSDVKDRERYWIDYYKEKGYNLINRTGGGDSIGTLSKSLDREIRHKQFVSKEKMVHKGKYDYSKVEYINSRYKVIIVCPVHGEFLQSPSHHIQGKGCPKCGLRKKS